MSPPQNKAEPRDGGFWRLRHDDLAAALARHDLNGEALRVYLALADLTFGYGKTRDVVSLSQIADRAGLFTTNDDGRREYRCPQVARALRMLRAKGLYGHAPADGQTVTRWVVWPAPPSGTTAEPGTTAEAGSSQSDPMTVSTTAGATADVGKHQDPKTKKKRPPSGAAARPDSDEGTPELGQDGEPQENRLVAKLVGFWCREHERQLARKYPRSGKGRLAGTLKRLLRDFTPNELQAVIGFWFAAERDTYSIGLFERKLVDGDADLRGEGRPPAAGREFTAVSASASYDELARTFGVPT